MPRITLNGWRKLKVRYYLVKIELQCTEFLKPYSICVIDKSRNASWLSFSFSILNCLHIFFEFTWSSNPSTPSCCVPNMKNSSPYLNSKDYFSGVYPKAKFWMYCTYILANNGDKGELITKRGLLSVACK